MGNGNLPMFGYAWLDDGARLQLPMRGAAASSILRKAHMQLVLT